MAEKTVAIVGVGTVGSQVARMAADAGWTVIGIEKDADSATGGRRTRRVSRSGPH